MLNKLIIPAVAILFVFSCTTPEQKENTPAAVKKEIREPRIPNYVNALNHHVSVNTDSVQIGKNKTGKILFDFNDSTLMFKICFEGYRDTLSFNATSLEFYEEEDFTGDGIKEIGILPGWDASACRIYSLFDVSKGKWKQIAYAESHLPDREKGVDYFAWNNEKLSVTTASFDCCCQCECLSTETVGLK